MHGSQNIELAAYSCHFVVTKVCLSVAVLTSLFLFTFIKQIFTAGTQIDNLRTPITVVFQTCAFEAVERITDAFLTTDEAFIAVVSERAFVACSHECRGANVRVANDAFAIAFRA